MRLIKLSGSEVIVVSTTLRRLTGAVARLSRRAQLEQRRPAPEPSLTVGLLPRTGPQDLTRYDDSLYFRRALANRAEL